MIHETVSIDREAGEFVRTVDGVEVERRPATERELFVGPVEFAPEPVEEISE